MFCSDSDLEVVADFLIVKLRCPMSGPRMKVAGRFKPCAHMGRSDLEIFVEMNQRSRKASDRLPDLFLLFSSSNFVFLSKHCTLFTVAMSHLSQELFSREGYH